MTCCNIFGSLLHLYVVSELSLKALISLNLLMSYYSHINNFGKACRGTVLSNLILIAIEFRVDCLDSLLISGDRLHVVLHFSLGVECV